MCVAFSTLSQLSLLKSSLNMCLTSCLLVFANKF
nr:MAG TPA: hypothetical protein [Caudoviricetes sp.]